MRADWIRLMISAARLPLRTDPAKSQVVRLEIWLDSEALYATHKPHQ